MPLIIEIILWTAIMLFLLALMFLFAGFETGAISINQIELENRAKKNRSLARLLEYVRHPDVFLGTTLLGTNITTVLLATISTYLVHRINSPFINPKYTALIVGGVALIFGEVFPKAYFRSHADTLVPKVFPLMRFISYMLSPFVLLVTWLNRGVRKLLKISSEQNFNYLTKDDLAYLLSITSTDAKDEPQLEMIEDALDFTEQEAHNVMVPRTDVIAIQESATIAEAIEIAREEGFTRYPVYRQNLDDIVGILIIYDVLKREFTPQTPVSKLMLEPYFTPENTDLDVLLREMQKQHRSMAIVVDSYGGTSGIVTMEDILEEIVGDIEDEYDVEDEAPDVQQVSPNTWLASADVEIDTLAEDHGIDLPEGDYETLAGLILDRLERIPLRGQVIELEPWRIQVLQATEKKILKVKLHKMNKRGEST